MNGGCRNTVFSGFVFFLVPYPGVSLLVGYYFNHLLHFCAVDVKSASRDKARINEMVTR